jgi:hypothetical protein
MVKKWKKIRIGLLIAVSVMQFFVYLNSQILIEPRVMIDNIVSTNLYFFLGLFILIMLEITFDKKVDKVQEMDWNNTLFTFSQPVQFFNYSGWLVFSAFLIPTLHSLIVGSEYLLDNIFMLSLGVTTILCTHFVYFLLQKNRT